MSRFGSGGGGVEVEKKEFTASTTWSTPDANWYRVHVIGAGGGGAGPDNADNVGGAGGGRVVEQIPGDIVPDSVTITVGAGGAGATGSGSGSDGGASAFGGFVEASGGQGGPYGDGGGLYGAASDSNYTAMAPKFAGAESTALRDGQRSSMYGGTAAGDGTDGPSTAYRGATTGAGDSVAAGSIYPDASLPIEWVSGRGGAQEQNGNYPGGGGGAGDTSAAGDGADGAVLVLFW